MATAAEPPLPDLGAAGAAMREEWRAEQEAATRDAAEQWQHTRTLLDVAREHMHRGDRLALVVAGHRVAGVIVDVADDRIVVADTAGRVDVHLHDALPIEVTVVERARAGGRSGTRAVRFRARLLELESAGEPVTVATAGGDLLTGPIAVGADHVVVTTARGATTVPLRAVAFAATG